MSEPRYAGLTYASVAGVHGAGGWQVHARSPGLGPEDERMLTTYAVTAFDSHEPALPPFVEPEAVAALPLRFRAQPIPGGTLIRQAVQAGADATGRPGNVFTTVLLDRRGGSAPLPVRLWRSPDLLAPFGARAITLAAPQWDVRPGTSVDTVAVAGLVTDPACWALLAVMLDAAAAAAAGGPVVVVRARDQDDAARWIGAVCLLTAPAWSAGLSWSLYERGDALEGLHLVAVPPGDDPGADAIVLDTAEQPTVGMRDGEAHTTADGTRVAVSEWSELVTELFALDVDETSALLDVVAATEGTGGGSPAWWLATALLGADRLPDDLAAAARAVLGRTPAPPGLGDSARTALHRALESDGPADPTALRASLVALGPGDARSGPVAGRFVAAALADVSWLDTAEPLAEVPEPVVREDVGAVATALRVIVGEGSAPLRRLGNTIDVLAVAGLLDVGDPRIEEPLADLAIAVAPMREPTRRSAFIAQLDRLPDRVRRAVLPDLVGLLPEERLVAAAATWDLDDVRRLADQESLTEAARAAILLRLSGEEALAEGRWRLDLPDHAVLAAADRLAGGGHASTAAMLTAAVRVLPVIALTTRRFTHPGGDSPFEQLLRRRTDDQEPLPAAAVGVLADRLRDEQWLLPALAYAASRGASGSDEALRRTLAAEGGDLLDLALDAVVAEYDGDRRAVLAGRAQALLSERDDAGRAARLWRRPPGVAEYLDARGLELPRRAR